MSPTIDTLPRRRGIVMRADGITDTYGKRYVRVNGGLRRMPEEKPRAPIVLGGYEL